MWEMAAERCSRRLKTQKCADDLIDFGRIAASKIGKGRSRPETQGYFRPSLGN